MKYQINRSIKDSAYLQLYKQVREDIINGIYGYGSKLPSKRLAAGETGVSTVTVEHAYALLCDEGYVESRERSGYIVVFRQDDGFMSASDMIGSVPHQFSAQSSNMSFSFPLMVKTMRKVMNDYGVETFERSPNEGCIYLREEISRYLERSRGIKADPSQIIIGSGSEYLYDFIVGLFGREKIYAIESPSYKKIEQVYRMCGVKYEMLPLGSDGISSRDLNKSGASILHISPYRSFPSGITASASKRHEYVRWAQKNDRYIIEDDFESEFSVSKKSEETLFTLTKCDNVIYMNTFSQTISPSLRVGYMIIPKHLISQYRETLGFYSCTVPTFIQYVLAEIIQNGDFERHINRERRKKRKELQTEGKIPAE